VSDARTRRAAMKAAAAAREPDPAPPPPPAVVDGPPARVRQTVDLDPEQHAEFHDWIRDTAARLRAQGVKLERGKLSVHQVGRALVAELLADDSTARRVRLRIEDELSAGAQSRSRD
jgi:hypothetical protein